MRVRTAAPFLALAAAVTLLYLRPIAFGETFCLRDHLTWTIPSRAAVGEAFKHGHLPEWWDHIGIGVPLAASPLHEVAYPPTWILRWVSPPVGTDAIVLLHALWLGMGVLVLARRLGAGGAAAAVGGVAACASGYAVSMMVDGIPMITMAWTPWIAWASDRLALATPGERQRAGAWVALMVGLQIISADPAGVISAVLVAGAITLARAPRPAAAVARLAAAMAGGVVLSAVATWPALLLLRESERAGGIAQHTAQVWSMHPLRMLEWLWPGVLGDPTQPAQHLARAYADAGGGGLDPGWALSDFVGVPVLMLAGFAASLDREKRWLGAATVILVLLGLGGFTPLYAVWRWLFPPERLIRYPEKHLAGVLVLWCSLAAVGLEAALAQRRRRLAIAALAAGGAILLLAGALALWRHDVAAALVRARALGVDTEAALAQAVVGGVFAGGATLMFGMALLLQRHRRWAFGLAAASIFAPLLAHGWDLQPMIPRAVLDQPPALLAEAKPARLYRPRDLLRGGVLVQRATAGENMAAPYGFTHVPGYDPAHAARFHQFWDAAAAHGTRLLQLFDVEWAILPAPTPVPWTKVASTGDGSIVLGRIGGRRPRAFVAHGWRWHASDDDATRALFSVPPPPFDEVQLTGSGTAQASAGEATPCAIASDRPEHVELTCEGAGYAVLLDAWAPGWTATVDGSPAAIVRADAVARAVAIGPGPHHVDFRYRTPGLRAGAAISLPALLACLALIVRRRRSAP